MSPPKPIPKRGKKQNSRPPRSIPRNVARKALPKPQDHSMLTHKVCSISDPFCPAAVGSKWPDGGSSRSMPYTARYQTMLSTSAAGACGLLFEPTLFYPFNLGTVASGVFTAALNNTVLHGQTPQYFRIVSCGLRIRSVANANNAQGIVRIRGFQSQKANNYSTIDVATFNNDFSSDIPLMDAKDVVVLSKRTETDNPFQDAGLIGSITHASWLGCGWTPILVSVEGGPASTAVINVELVIHYEFIYDDSNGMAIAMSPAPPKNTLLTDASDYVRHTAGNIFKSGAATLERTFISTAKSYLLRALSLAPLGRPLALLGGMAMEVD